MSINSKMTAIANPIRTLMGKTGKMGLDAMSEDLGVAVTEVDAQNNLIQQIKTALAEKAGGLELPPLDDAARATASDMAQGKQLYDENGNLVEGGLKVWTGIVTQNTLPSYDEASGKIILNANHTEKVIVDKGNMIMRSYASNFGNAKREEVVKGKFFTSEAGLMVEGGLEVGTAETWTLTLEDGSTVEKVVYVK